jgi:hypothetical protein
VHGLEHLSETDRGIGRFRNQMRRGVRAVKGGSDPAGLCREPGAVLATYCNNTVMRIPPESTAASDKKMMREIGMRLARGYLKAPPLINGG